MRYDGQIIISTGDSCKCIHWKPKTLLWSALVERLRTPTRTQETAAEYKALSKPRKAEIKDVGGFVGGQLRGGRRKADAVISRQVLTLDMDNIPAGADTWPDVDLLGCAAALYSTHSHTKEAPRLRLVFPLSRPATPEEYGAISRKVAQEIGIDMCDDTTYEPHRLMYWPSAAHDGDYRYEVQDGPWLDVDEVLAQYDDWRDVAQWPTSSRKAEVIRKLAKKQGDPREKPGLIGAFCRAYSVSAAIDTFLSGVYAPCGEGRYTYAAGSTAGGLVLYDGDTFAYSHHATDPCGERLVNAFDMVRLHLFGEKDDEMKPDTPVNKLPSFQAMCEFASADGEVKVELAKQGKQLVDEFGEGDAWKKQLDYDRKGRLKDSLDNFLLIMRHDEGLQGLAFNMHRDGIGARAPLPWEQVKLGWAKTDQASLESYISQAHGGLYAPTKVKTALLTVVAERKFHPVQEYFNGLPPWDSTPRLDTLLVDCLNADDTPYVRAVTRKTLVAAVARTYKPGTKFDTALVLVGPRDIGKSTLWAMLGGEWYSGSLRVSDMQHDKTAPEKLQGFLIVELSELDGMRKTSIETVKSFMSTSDDKYRASYGESVEPHPRQCIIVGTSNDTEGFLRDVTGNRNFWPVNVNKESAKKPWDLSQFEIDQLWAEAKFYYEQGEKLYLEGGLKQEAQKHQEAARETDERAGAVQQFLEKLLPSNWNAMQLYDRQRYLDGECFGGDEIGTEQRTEVCNAEIWCECFGKRLSDMKKSDSYDLKALMQQVPGWERQDELKRFGPYGPQRYYKRVETSGATSAVTRALEGETSGSGAKDVTIAL